MAAALSRIRFRRHILCLNDQAACCVIDRAGPEQDRKVGNLAIYHRLFQGPRLTGGPVAVHGWRRVGGQGIVEAVVV